MTEATYSVPRERFPGYWPNKSKIKVDARAKQSYLSVMQTTNTNQAGERTLYRVDGITGRFENGRRAAHYFVRHFKTHCEAEKCALGIDSANISEVIITVNSLEHLRRIAGI